MDEQQTQAFHDGITAGMLWVCILGLVCASVFFVVIALSGMEAGSDHDLVVCSAGVLGVALSLVTMYLLHERISAIQRRYE